MKIWHTFIIAAFIACSFQVGQADAAEKVQPAPNQIAAELAAAIAAMDRAILDADERAQRIALMISRTTYDDPMGSPHLLAELSRLVEVADLPLVSASAIMSSGTRSPAVLRAMTSAQNDDRSRIAAVREGATHPTSVLGTETIALVQSAEVRSAQPAPVVTPPLVLTSAPIVVQDPPLALAAPQPPPVQPPGLPVRPPALPYRGQL